MRLERKLYKFYRTVLELRPDCLWGFDRLDVNCRHKPGSAESCMAACDGVVQTELEVKHFYIWTFPSSCAKVRPLNIRVEAPVRNKVIRIVFVGLSVLGVCGPLSAHH